MVRPCLADYRGFAIVSGTSNGDDHFHKVKLRAEDDPNWDIFDIKVTDTHEDALSTQEVADMRADMSPDEFAREMLNTSTRRSRARSTLTRSTRCRPRAASPRSAQI